MNLFNVICEQERLKAKGWVEIPRDWYTGAMPGRYQYRNLPNCNPMMYPPPPPQDQTTRTLHEWCAHAFRVAQSARGFGCRIQIPGA